MSLSPRHLAYFLLIALFWGGSFFAIKIAVTDWPPISSAFFRVFFGLICILILILFRKPAKKGTRSIQIQSFFIGWFSMGIAWAFLFWAEQGITGGLASILNSTVPLLTIALTPFITSFDKLTAKKIAGVVIGFFGILILFAPDIAAGESAMFYRGSGVLAMALCYAIGVLWTRRVTHHISSTYCFLWQAVGGSFSLLVCALIFEGNPFHVFTIFSWNAFISILYLAIFSTTIAWLLFIVLLREIGSVEATSVTYVVPIVSILLDYIFIGTLVPFYAMIGAVVILLGVWFTQPRRPASLTAPTEDVA